MICPLPSPGLGNQLIIYLTAATSTVGCLKVSEILVDGVDATDRVVMAVPLPPPSGNLAMQLGDTRGGIQGWLRHGLSRGRFGMLPFGITLLDFRVWTRALLGLGRLVAFSAKGLPA